MQIDHVIYGTSDLEGASSRLASELGVPALPGGRHEGMGTENRILPLGRGYLELLAIWDPVEAAESALGSALQSLVARGDGLIGWAVAVDDAASVAARLGTPLTRISREGFTANLTGVAEAMRRPFLPFFISRDEGIPDPAAGADAGGISWIEVAGDPDELRDWLDGAQLPVRVVDGEPAVRAIGIGDRELRP